MKSPIISRYSKRRENGLSFHAIGSQNPVIYNCDLIGAAYLKEFK